MKYTPPFKPYAHQEAALKKMDGKGAFALLMEMRTGKTKTLLDDFGRLELAGKVRNLLVLAPGGVYRTWEEACATHLSADLKQRALVHVWKSGAGAREKALRKAFLSENAPRIFIMNVEALSSVKEARDIALSFLKSGKAMLAVDESTCIKTFNSKRTKFINGTLSQFAEYRRILSGLPSPNSPLDLYSQFEFLDWKIIFQRSYYAFRNRYAIMQKVSFGGREVPIVKGYRDVTDLNARIEPHSYRCRLEDCYDVPPKLYIRREVEMTDEQRRLYKSMLETATAELESSEHVTATIVIAQILRLHQILCGHVRDELGGFHEVLEKRTASLLELLEEYQGKAIIWCSYDANVRRIREAIAKEYGDKAVAAFWGGNIKGREEEEARFLKDPLCRFMISTPAAGGRGRTWTVANLIVYYSNTYNLEHRAQSEERGQGIGKMDRVTYVDLVTPGTVDEKILSVLRNKINLSSIIMGDKYKEWLI